MKMIRTPISQKQKLFISVLSVLLIVAAYMVMAHVQYSKNPDNTTMPTLKLFKEGFVSIFSPRIERTFTPEGTVETKTLMKSWFVSDSLITGWRFSLSMLLSVAIGVSVGLLMGCFARVEAFFNWPITFFSKVTPTGALVVFFVLFGTDLKMFVAMIVFGVTPAIAISTMLAVKQMPEQLIHKGYTIGASTWESVLSNVFKYILPNIIDAIRLAVGPAIIFLIAAESLCADSGFGYRIRMQGKLSNMNVVYTYLAMLAMFGFFADWGLKVLQRKACQWYRGNS